MVKKKKKKPLERREHKRYSANAATCALKSKTGQIIDISMGGLAFSYIDRGDWSNESLELGMLFGEGDLCIDELPLKIISDCAIGNGISMIRRCGVKFGELTPKQIAQLEYFIWANTAERNEKDFLA
ncbi:MAG: PilZ domain-containing protein [Proteobacteria bacterium]|nr:PilZ domain-containing protein [Pseudomonadota bacterium]MBU1714448.1 PilZ domain-containing protein [Pseudomonadota bacterium]